MESLAVLLFMIKQCVLVVVVDFFSLSYLNLSMENFITSKFSPFIIQHHLTAVLIKMNATLYL